MEMNLFPLICQAIQKDDLSVSFDPMQVNFSALFKIAGRHEIKPLVAYGLLRTGRLNREQENFCRKVLYKDIMRMEQMDWELHRICLLLEKANVDYMPLKGAVLRKFYPEPWLRTSCDIDILVRDIDRAVRILEENGYTSKGRGSHDVILTSPLGITIELHFKLIETNPKVNSLLEHVWEYTAPREGTCCYEMEPEIFYFYHIAHMAKHMCFGGSGIRSFVDIWLLKEKLTMDEEKKNLLLQAGGLAVFAEQAEKLCCVWFGNQQPDLLLQELERFILNGGVLGSKSNAVMIQRTKANTSATFFFLRIFMPYSRMKLKYPVLQRYPVLLPVFWIWRWIELALKGRKICNAIQELTLNNNLDQQSISATRWLFEELALF